MGRNSKRLRRQDWETELEEEIEISQSEIPEPPTRNHKVTHSHFEGEVVNVNLGKGKYVPSTVIQVIGDTLLCLETGGLIHMVKAHDVFSVA